MYVCMCICLYVYIYIYIYILYVNVFQKTESIHHRRPEGAVCIIVLSRFWYSRSPTTHFQLVVVVVYRVFLSILGGLAIAIIDCCISLPNIAYVIYLLYIYIRIYTYTYLYRYIYIYIHIYTYIHICIYIYICTYIRFITQYSIVQYCHSRCALLLVLRKLQPCGWCRSPYAQ